MTELLSLIDKVFPLPARFRAGLSCDVNELSRLLTSARSERSSSYLGKSGLLSAYLRYFLPWNIYRLSKLLPSLPLDLKEGDAINDLGAGPLTFALSLWISRPDLRAIPLEIRCLDKTPAALDAGKKLFAAMTSETTCPWKVKTIRGELYASVKKAGLSVEIRGKPASLTVIGNVYNEFFSGISPRDRVGFTRMAAGQAGLLSSFTAGSGKILVVEPGVPRSGEFISLLRASLIEEGRAPIAPCTHRGPCPLSGGHSKGKAKWCHFAFDTSDAPKDLHRLSVMAKLPKERAVLSFLLAGPAAQGSTVRPAPAPARGPAAQGSTVRPAPAARLQVRIISDSFPVGRDFGRYGCCERGLVLVVGNRESIECLSSGVLTEVSLTGRVDEKSGALIAK